MHRERRPVHAETARQHMPVRSVRSWNAGFHAVSWRAAAIASTPSSRASKRNAPPAPGRQPRPRTSHSSSPDRLPCLRRNGKSRSRPANCRPIAARVPPIPRAATPWISRVASRRRFSVGERPQVPRPRAPGVNQPHSHSLTDNHRFRHHADQKTRPRAEFLVEADVLRALRKSEKTRIVRAHSSNNSTVRTRSRPRHPTIPVFGPP